MSRSGKPWLAPQLMFGVLLVCVVVSAFGRTLSHELLGWDDKFHTTRNSMVNPPTTEGLARAWRQPYGNLYIPVSYNFFALEALVSEALWGDVRPAVFHAGNLLLYAGCILLVWRLFRRLMADETAAAIGALFFALHPIQVETVAWVSETRGLLAALFAFAALYTHLKDTSTLRGNLISSTVATGLFALAVLAKPSVAPVPLIAYLLDRYWLNRSSKSALIRVIPMLFISAGAMILAQTLQSTSTKASESPIWARPVIALDAVAFYLRKLVWPVGLAPDYSRTPALLLCSAERYYTWGIACVPLLFIVLRRNWRTRGAVLYAVFIAGLSPVLGIIVFHHQRISTVADRYAFLSMIAPALLLTWVVSKNKSPAATLACAVVLAGLGALSFRQAGWWKDEQTLFTHTLAVNPRSALAHTNLGYLQSEQGRKDEAVEHYEQALKINPEHAMALNNLGSVLQKKGDLGRAEDLYRRAITADGAHSMASENLGLLLAEKGNLEEAITWLEEAVRLEPDRAVPHNSLGVILERAGMRDRAIEEYRAALRANPNHILANVNLGLALAASGNEDEAITHWRRAVELNDRQIDAHSELGKACLRRGQPDLAEPHLRRVRDLRPGDAKTHNNLGVALIQQGRRDEAVECFRRALAIAPNFQSARENLDRAMAGG